MTRMEEASIAFKELHPLGSKQREIIFREGVYYADSHPISPWISVEDRLPENGQIVVSYVERHITGGGENLLEHQMLVERFKDKFICDKDQKHRMCGYEFHVVEKTTYWMPLIEP